MMEYFVNGVSIPIKIIRKNNKNLYMRFDDSACIVVTCNQWVSEKEIKSILKKNEDSIMKMYQGKKKELEKSGYFYYLGKKYVPVYDNLSKIPSFENDTLFIKDEKTLLKFQQKECERIFKLELERILPSFEKIPAFSLKIRKMKTRWGVNNRGSKTITLNSDLLGKDYDLLDYVIIHELCHFYEPNHSEYFWAHVEKYYPKYKEARKRLRG